MERIKSKLTVYFENPFWIGIFEQICDEKLSVAKVTFGAEPKDYELQEFLLKRYTYLQFTKSIEIDVKKSKQNPKRALREVKKQVHNIGIGTKSQQALKLQQEQRKKEQKCNSKRKKEIETKRLFALKQQKKKAKHRGH